MYVATCTTFIHTYIQAIVHNYGISHPKLKQFAHVTLVQHKLHTHGTCLCVSCTQQKQKHMWKGKHSCTRV